MFKNRIRNYITDVGTQNDLARETWVKTSLGCIPAGSRLLDAGAGQQRYRQYCTHLQYVSQDFCQYNGNENDSALHSKDWDTSTIDIVSDIIAIPEPGSSFDAVLCTEVLEHVPDPVAAIREFNRLLRPGGILILTVPFCSLTHMAPYHFYSGFNRYFLEHYLPAIGFDIKELAPNGDYNEFLAQELRRLPTLYPSLPLTVAVAFRLVLRYLGKTRNTGSSTRELLCYGFHVRAAKRGNG